MKQYIQEFMKKHDLDDVKSLVKGELNEYSTDLATYFYGNGELIVSPADESQDEIAFYVNNVRGFDELVLF